MKRKWHGRGVFLICLASLFLALAGGRCAEGDDSPPGRIQDLTYIFRADALIWNGAVSAGDTAGLPDTRLLAWTSPGDDKYSGTASLYDLRYLTAQDARQMGFTDGAAALAARWDDARQLFNEPYPQKAGRLEQLFLPRLNPGDTVWFAVKTKDEIGQESKISNIAGPLHIHRLTVPLRPAAGDTVVNFGSSIAATGDVNGDGSPDFMVGSPKQGTVSLFLGGSANLLAGKTNSQGINVTAAVSELSPIFTLQGETAEGFGQVCAGLYNLNDDSYYDLAAGAPFAAEGSTLDAGAVYIYYGRAVLPSTLSADSVDVILRGEAAGDRFGSALASVFDLDLDGDHEFLASAPGAFSGRGAVYVFRAGGLISGSASQAAAVLIGETAGDEFGAFVSSIGDVNGDGYADFAVSAPGHDLGNTVDAGAVYIFYGGGSGAINFPGLGSGQTALDLASARADVTIYGTAAGRRFGKRVAAGGDLSGDGGPAYDFAVAGGDTVFVFFGGPDSSVPFPLAGSTVKGFDREAAVKLSGAAGEEFGAGLIGLGDTDRDGDDDLAVGAPGENKVYIFYGPLAPGASPKEVLTAAPGSRFGETVLGIGDATKDDFVDMMVSAPSAGEAYFIF